jgi:hypothetical protein
LVAVPTESVSMPGRPVAPGRTEPGQVRGESCRTEVRGHVRALTRTGGRKARQVKAGGDQDKRGPCTGERRGVGEPAR